MRRTITRVLAATAAGAVLSSLGLTGASASAVPGAQAWASRYSGVAGGGGHASAVAVSLGGRRVFVAGDSLAAPSASDYAVVAYNATTGAQLWVRRYSSARGVIAIATSVAVSPSGKTVYVTGYSGNGYATIAYSTATGARQWVTRYTGPASSDDLAAGLTVGPGGQTVYVTGSSFSGSGWAYATVAYNAATGAQRWAVRESGNGDDNAHAVAVSPGGGGTVLVTGSSYTGTSTDYFTIAYSAATGARRWTARYSGPVGDSIPGSMTVSPSGKTVFVTGDSRGATSGHDYATVAYNTATGARQWARRYNGPANRDDSAASVAVTPGRGKVLVTGYSQSAAGGADYATVAYNAATGAQQWVRRYNGPARLDDEASSVGVSPTGRTVYVTGYSGVRISGRENAQLISDYATVAYNAATGAQLWVRRYNGPARKDDEASALAVSPTGGRVFVTGFSVGTKSRPDFATIAYRG
ncbi:MAG: PQQ-binding-like beta-propeller repeat protein [Streptosporangiaceae bacterium]